VSLAALSRAASYLIVVVLSGLTVAAGYAPLNAHATKPSLELQVPEAVLGKGNYEYEVSTRAELTKSSLVRNGEGNLKELTLDLEPGVYYVRFRNLKIAGKANGATWSAPQKITVSSLPAVITAPLSGERVEFANSKDVLRVEWESVPGADEYEVRMSSTAGASRQASSEDPYVELSGLVAGRWQLKVIALARKQIVSESAPLSFELVYGSSPRVQVLQPRFDALIPAEEQSRVRWKAKGSPSAVEVVVRSIDEKGARHVESRERVSEDENETIIPALVPGRYEVSIAAGSRKEIVATREFRVAEVNYVLTAPQPRMRGYMLGSFVFAHRTMDNSKLESAGVGGLRSGRSGGMTEIGGDLRITRKFSLEGGMSAEFFGYGLASGAGAANGVPVTLDSMQGPSGGGLRFGFRYREDLWGPRFPTEFRLVSQYRYIKQYIPSDKSTASNLELTPTNLGLVSLGLGTDLNWIPRRGLFRILFGTLLEMPIFRERGPKLGVGGPQFLPSLSFHVLIRRELNKVLYFTGGVDMRVELLGVREESGARATTLRSFVFGPQAGLGLRL
jgi:hypothetical protein